MDKSKQTEKLHSKQNSDESPVIENAKLAKMGEDTNPPRRINGKILYMPSKPTNRGNKKLMNTMPTNNNETDTFEGINVEFPKQEEYKPIRKKSSRQKGGYLRLRLRQQDGKLSLLEAHKVDGPLIIEDRINSSLFYEALIYSKRVAIGSITDVGFNRSFPNPKGPHGQEGHLFVKLPSYEFYVRLPSNELSSLLLPKVEIVVYKVKRPINKTISEKSIAAEFRNKVHEVARLKGISMKSISKKSQKEIIDLLKKHQTRMSQHNS